MNALPLLGFRLRQSSDLTGRRGKQIDTNVGGHPARNYSAKECVRSSKIFFARGATSKEVNGRGYFYRGVVPWLAVAPPVRRGAKAAQRVG